MAPSNQSSLKGAENPVVTDVPTPAVPEATVEPQSSVRFLTRDACATKCAPPEGFVDSDVGALNYFLGHCLVCESCVNAPSGV